MQIIQDLFDDNKKCKFLKIKEIKIKVFKRKKLIFKEIILRIKNQFFNLYS